MKKYNKFLMVVFSISMTLFISSLIILRFVDKGIKPYLTIPILIATAMLPISMCVVEIVSSLYNLNNCSAGCFNKINKIAKGMKSSDLEFQEAVMYINQSYTVGEVKKIIEQKSIYNLYERKDFLLKNISLYDDITQVYSSLIISVLSSLLVMTIEPEMAIVSLFVYFIVALFFMFVIFHKYSYRGQNGSYIHFLYEYELKLLDEAIHSIENNLKAEPEIVPFIETRHNVLDVLYRKSIKAKRKTKPKIENDIAIVKQLKLEVEKNSCFILKEYEMIIDKKSAKCLTGKICVAYIVDENGIECFASDDFRMLYEIAAKYDLCVDIQ